jgi:hypothetical protein
MTVAVAFVALKDGKFPLPEAAIPVAVLLFTQEYVVPLTPKVLVNGTIELLEPTQIAWFAI